MTPTIPLDCPRSLLVEHVMRWTCDDLNVIPFLVVAPGSREYLAALGRLLTSAPGEIPAGSPLAVWAGSGVLDPQWRDLCRTVPSSVWGELETLRSLTSQEVLLPGDLTAADLSPFEELEALRSRL